MDTESKDPEMTRRGGPKLQSNQSLSLCLFILGPTSSQYTHSFFHSFAPLFSQLINHLG